MSLRRIVGLVLISMFVITGCDKKTPSQADATGDGGVSSPNRKASGAGERSPAPTSEFHKMRAGFGELYIPARPSTRATISSQGIGNLPGSYDPRQLMPLALGNLWTYRWHSPRCVANAVVRTEAAMDPLFMHTEFYIYGERMRMMTASAASARNHEETCKIVRQDGDHYFFEISSNPPVDHAGQLRDGRYSGSVENTWTWTDNRSTSGGSSGGSVVLTESIKRKSAVGFHSFFEGSPEAKTLDPERTILEDHRMVLLVPFQGGEWAYSEQPTVYQVGGFSLWYNSVSQTVQVPAGTFQGCLETVEFSEAKERRPDGSEVPRYKTHSFWAPGTGLVREYQELADGKIAFERELVKFVQGASSARK